MHYCIILFFKGHGYAAPAAGAVFFRLFLYEKQVATITLPDTPEPDVQ